jgi:hypothetical protein
MDRRNSKPVLSDRRSPERNQRRSHMCHPVEPSLGRKRRSVPAANARVSLSNFCPSIKVFLPSFYETNENSNAPPRARSNHQARVDSLFVEPPSPFSRFRRVKLGLRPAPGCGETHNEKRLPVLRSGSFDRSRATGRRNPAEPDPSEAIIALPQICASIGCRAYVSKSARMRGASTQHGVYLHFISKRP